MDIPETFSGIGLQVPGVPLLRISILDTRLEQRPGSAGGAAWWLWLPMKVAQMLASQLPSTRVTRKATTR